MCKCNPENSELWCGNEGCENPLNKINSEVSVEVMNELQECFEKAIGKHTLGQLKNSPDRHLLAALLAAIDYKEKVFGIKQDSKRNRVIEMWDFCFKNEIAARKEANRIFREKIDEAFVMTKDDSNGV